MTKTVHRPHSPSVDGLFLSRLAGKPRQPARGERATEAQARPAQDETSSTAVNIAVSVLFLSCSMFLWVRALPLIDPAPMTNLGLASVLPLDFWLALLGVTLAFVAALESARLRWPLAVASLLMLIVILHLTPALVYDYPRYSWTWKHVGIIDFILRHGWVDQSVRFLNVYHNWPAFFLSAAWIAEALQAKTMDIINAARFAPPVFQALNLLALVPLYRGFDRNPQRTLVAMWIFVAGNWIGQDYFSPQAVAFLFYLLLLGLCLGPLRIEAGWLGRLSQRLAASMPRLHAASGLLFVPPQVRWLPSARVLASVAATVLIVGIVAVHQLTPIAMILALSALVALGRLRPTYLVLALFVEVAYLFYVATPFVAANMASQIRDLGSGIAATSERLVDTSLVSPETAFVVMAGRFVAALIAGLALAGGLRRLWSGRLDLLPGALAVAPLALFAMAYGGEVMFRVYLFALPFFAYFAAASFYPHTQSAPSSYGRFLLAAGLSVLTVGFVIANNGKDREYHFTSDEVAAATWLYTNAQPGTILIEGSPNYPGQFMNYEQFFYLPLARERASEREAILSHPDDTFVRWLQNSDYRRGYVIITRSQKAGVDSLGFMPPGSLDRIEQVLLRSSRFRLVYANRDATIFALSATPQDLENWRE